MLPPARFKLPVALNSKLLVDATSPEPDPVDIKLFATTLPDTNTLGVVKLIVPAAVMFKLPVDVNVAEVAEGDTKLLEIILPALILPVYVAKNAPTLALVYSPVETPDTVPLNVIGLLT